MATDWDRKPPKGWDAKHPHGCWMDDLKKGVDYTKGVEKPTPPASTTILEDDGAGIASLAVQKAAMDLLLNQMKDRKKDNG